MGRPRSTAISIASVPVAKCGLPFSGDKAGRIAAQAIATRGKSGVGDKTVLDALIPSLDAAGATADDPLGAAVQAARAGVEATRDLVSVRGRAAWVGERTRGHADPGAVAYLRLLEAFVSSSTEAPA